MRLQTPSILTAALTVFILLSPLASSAQQPERHQKMSTPLPPEIASPNRVDTRLGTLEFFDGFPDDSTVEKVYDNLDFQRAVQAYLMALPPVSMVGLREGLTKAATPAPLSDDERARLLEQIRKLEQKVAELEAGRGDAPRSYAPAAVPATAEVAPQQANPAGSGAAPAPEAGQGNLAQQATDPTAALMSHTIKTTISPSYWGIDDNANVVTFQSVIPFKVWDKVNILRVNVPYTSTGPTSAGIGDVTVFDLVIFKRKAGTIGVGPLVNFRRNRNSDADTFEVGPAFVFIGTKGRLQYGIFNQNFFSTTTATSSFQPILAYQLGQGWSVSTGDMQVLVDWKQPAFVSIPASLQLGKVTTLGGQPVRFFVNPQYNLKNTSGTTKWSVTFGFTILVPLRR